MEKAQLDRIVYKEYQDAMEWCRSTGARGQAAVAAGKWPNITRKGLEERLDGEVINGAEYAGLRLLTVYEEEDLASCPHWKPSFLLIHSEEPQTSILGTIDYLAV